MTAASETEVPLAAHMFKQLDSQNPSANTRLSSLRGDVRFATRYAKEQNMKVFANDAEVPERTFNRILLYSLDGDSQVRNASADALRSVLRDLTEEQKTAALWHVAYSLREHSNDQSRSSYQGRILSSASFFRDDPSLISRDLAYREKTRIRIV